MFIRVSNLTKTYGDARAVDDLTIDITEGEMLVLLGPSGCGKTTTMRCIVGLETPDTGTVQIGDLTVTAVQVSHDALEPCGYHIASPHGTLTVLTDLGYPDPSLVEYLALSDLIVLEANHDRRLLQDGPYPTVLKRRIMSHSGHLSNDESAMLVARSIQDGKTPEIWLAHLSQINNRPEIALGTVHRILADQGHPPLMISALSRFGQDHVWRYGERSQRPIQSQLPLF